MRSKNAPEAGSAERAPGFRRGTKGDSLGPMRAGQNIDIFGTSCPGILRGTGFVVQLGFRGNISMVTVFTNITGGVPQLSKSRQHVQFGLEILQQR